MYESQCKIFMFIQKARLRTIIKKKVKEREIGDLRDASAFGHGL